MPVLLALDTSTRHAGIAVYDPARSLLAEHHWYAGQQHTVELLPEVMHLLEQSGITPADLAAVAVALGPGTFTGVRVALAAAKGLAVARGLVLLGIPTLDVVAYPHAGPRPVVALIQAGRGRVCWARYEQGTGRWQAQTPYALSTVADLATHLEGAVAVAGELTPEERATLARIGHRVQVLSPALALRRAGYLAEMGWARFQAGERDDLASLSPIYVQDPITHPKAGQEP